MLIINGGRGLPPCFRPLVRFYPQQVFLVILYEDASFQGSLDTYILKCIIAAQRREYTVLGWVDKL
jgi:hypothetical protein